MRPLDRTWGYYDIIGVMGRLLIIFSAAYILHLHGNSSRILRNVQRSPRILNGVYRVHAFTPRLWAGSVLESKARSNGRVPKRASLLEFDLEVKPP
jgi:hypothetical protein